MSGAIGVFGGSFDPPHVGHLMFVSYALAIAPIERVLVVPTFAHPFGKLMAPYADRIAMCAAAFAPFSAASVSRIEERLGGESFTIRTIEALRAQTPGTPLRLLVGADVLPDTPRWREWDRLVALAPPFVVGRSGSDPIGDGPSLPAISSTLVRERYRSAQSNERFVPRGVDAYVLAHGLYGTGAP